MRPGPSSVDSPAAIPRTQDGRPDLSGVWLAASLTPLERRSKDQPVVLAPEAAASLIAGELAFLQADGVEDPDVTHFSVRNLTVVRGEARSSLIVEPADGQLPLTDAARSSSARSGDLMMNGRDDPEQRPGPERCLTSFAHAPIRVFPLEVPFSLVQTSDTLVLTHEDVPNARIIPFGAQALSPRFPSISGTSRGAWEGDTLVVRTTHISEHFPYRDVFGPPIMVGPHSVVVERFTLVSPDEINYQFTVEDPALYTAPWLGEFTFRRSDFQVLEYACHEANYTMVNVLLAGRVEDMKKARAARRGSRR